MLRVRSILLASIFQMVSCLSAQADQWGSVVLAHCYDFDDQRYQEHFFTRVFRTELGGGQFFSKAPSLEAPKGLHLFNENPATCLINGKKVVFETVDYRAQQSKVHVVFVNKQGFELLSTTLLSGKHRGQLNGVIQSSMAQ